MSSARSLARATGAHWWLLMLLALLLAWPALAQPKFPPLTGRVVDAADILPPPIEAELTQKLEALEAQTKTQLVVATLPSLQGYEIEDYGYQLGRAWGIGQKGQNNGAILIVAPNERRVRIEVGYGLEPVLTDALSSVIIQTQILPRFRDGDIAGGIVAGTDALIEQLGLPPEQAQARAVAAAERARAESERGDGSIFGFIVPLLIIWFIFSIFRRMVGGKRYRRRGFGGPIIIWGPGSGGGWRGWGGGGGGFGGGGFSGGGGSFGGGGSSGSW